VKVKGRRGEPLRVVIAGGGGGPGLACAEALAASGAELILTDCDGVALTRAADRLGTFSRYCDAIGGSSVEVFAAELASLFPSIEVLINAAGRGYFRTLAMTRMTQAMLPLLRQATGRRLVINISSAGETVARDSIFPYASSLEAFDRLSERLREQVRGTGVEIVNIAPKLIAGRAANVLWADRLSELQQVDEEDMADRIIDLVAAARPDWRRCPPNIIRRAWQIFSFSSCSSRPADDAGQGSASVLQRARIGVSRGSSCQARRGFQGQAQ
jgi:NAD(P)-dependent dehydrogenase (short-subunit alcohol dehydrogenase family)